jgi:N-acetylmuramoyl-L-alanine amidase
MKIVDHRLVRDDGTPYRFVSTPNVSSGALKPTYLVMHYTAGSSAQESINWLANPEAKASAHIVIARDGTITQMVPFNKVAWHAGKSSWKGTEGLNSWSIGIELDNPGKLARKNGVWTSAFGGKYKDEEVLEAVHKNETAKAGWYRYPAAQMEAARQLSKLLVQTYGLKQVVGHEDISPGRKQDPGPSFPWPEFLAFVGAEGPPAAKAQAPAASAPAPAPAPAPTPAGYFRVTAELNIRTGPATANPAVPGSPLPAGTIVQALDESGSWKQVAVQGTVRGVSGIRGWVSAKFLEPAPPGSVPAPKIAGAQTPAGTGA